LPDINKSGFLFVNYGDVDYGKTIEKRLIFAMLLRKKISLLGF